MKGTSETNKRYYWLKLKDDFFRQKEIKQLRKIAGGDSFTIIYLKMLLRSLKDDGKLYYEGVDDDFVSELALDIDEDVENVKVTVTFLMSKGILVQSNTDEYALLTAGDMTGSEGYSAERMRRLRGKRLLASHSDNLVTSGDEEIEKEIDKRDRERNREKRTRFTPPTVEEVAAYASEKGYTGFNAQRFVDFYESKGWMVGKNKMKNWRSSVSGWASRDSEQTKGRPKEWHNPALDYDQRDYTGQTKPDIQIIDLNTWK